LYSDFASGYALHFLVLPPAMPMIDHDQCLVGHGGIGQNVLAAGPVPGIGSTYFKEP
jgi:hypothetical protein